MSGRPRQGAARHSQDRGEPTAAAAPQASKIAAHDREVRMLRRWALGGRSPDGLGDRLRHWRTDGRGWTRAPLAAETGVPVATLARMERDQQPVALPEYRLIVRALAVDPIEVRLALDKLELIAGGVRMTEAIDRCRKAPI